MRRRLLLSLFAEDIAHEAFVRALCRRIASEIGVNISLSVIAARGGHGRAVSELKAFQQVLIRQQHSADILIVAIDANCRGWSTKREEISAAVKEHLFRAVAIACPDPHIEKWYLADPVSLQKGLEISVRLTKTKCERGVYKRALAEAFLAGGYAVPLGGAEFAQDVVDAMDLYRAGKNDASLHGFIADLRAAFRAIPE